MDEFSLKIPADRLGEAKRLGVAPEDLFRVAETARTTLVEFYEGRTDQPPSPTAIPNAVAADLVLIGLRIGRGEVPEVLEVRDDDVLRIVIDFDTGADPDAVAMLCGELRPWTAGRALPYGARLPRVIRLEGGTA